MPELLMLSGLPASGKTTRAMQLVRELDYVRVNRDELRAMSADGKWSPERERMVVAAEKAIARSALDEGYGVVADDTNLLRKHEHMWSEIARESRARFVSKHFDTPLAECIRRDSRRSGRSHVGRGVIENMALNAGMVEWDERQIVIVDVDGTLADGSHRVGHIQKTPKDWGAYFSLLAFDSPRSAVCAWVRELALDYNVVIVSGRPAQYSDDTVAWLKAYAKLFDTITGADLFSHIFMRGTHDRRDDDIVKAEILHKLPKEKIAFVIDDRPRVVRMWRANGLKVYDVGEGVEF